MGVRKTKNWDLAGKLFTVEIPALLEMGAREVMRENAEIYMEQVIEMIEEQSGSWPPLTEEWVERKQREGGETDIYKFREEFLNYLKSDRSKQFVKGKWAESKMFVGARDSIFHEGNGKNGPISMFKLAEVLQFEYDRPLFDPAYERVKWTLKANWKHIAETAGVRWE